DATGVTNNYASMLGITEGMIALEFGWDEDCDPAISEAVEAVLGEDFLEEETDELVDVVVMWWREEDGDLVDGLVDALRPLGDGGTIWLRSEERRVGKERGAGGGGWR